jgi:DNA-binding response OmpR family regulator
LSAARIAVLADDLIWGTRLAGQVRSAAFEPVPTRAMDPFRAALPSVEAAIVDLTSRAYDGLAAIAAARDAGVPVLAVGQHDDHVLRRDALAVGADHVLAYRKLFEDGPATIARWMAARKERAGEPEEAKTR